MYSTSVKLTGCYTMALTAGAHCIWPVVCSVLSDVDGIFKSGFLFLLRFRRNCSVTMRFFQKIVVSSSIGDIYVIYSELNDCSLHRSATTDGIISLPLLNN